MKLINFHCHLIKKPDLYNFLKLSNDIFISNALTDEELKTHLNYNEENFKITAGQHPLYPENSLSEIKLINALENQQIFAVGEIGFDKRNPDFQKQKDIFYQFTDIAIQYNKPVIIHCVGYYYELYKLIQNNFPKKSFILHSFQGSLDIVKAFSSLNIIYSLHERIINRKNSLNILKEIFKHHNFVFETDDNEDCSVYNCLKKCSDFTKIPEEKLIEKQYQAYTNNAL